MAEDKPAQEQPALVLTDVSFSFPNRPAPVLDGASLSVTPGELCVLLGENGSGKSTLVQLALGELVADRGSICVLGTDVRVRRTWTCVGYVPQAGVAGLVGFPATVREVVCASVVGPRRAARARADELLARLGLTDLARHLMGELSGGQLQRVMLARALANRPGLLLLDEPTSGLDEAGARDFARLLVPLVDQEHTAALLVTHDLARLGDLVSGAHLARLENGRIESHA